MNLSLRSHALWTRAALALMCLLVAPTIGCGEAEEAPAPWGCTDARDDWSRCDGDRTIWCHGGQFPHFHNGRDCAAAGLSCMALSEREAVCVDAAASCTDGEVRCDGNTAQSCLGGVLAVEPCGTARTCVVFRGEARCDAKPSDECSGHGLVNGDACDCNSQYVRDPNDPMACIPEASS